MGVDSKAAEGTVPARVAAAVGRAADFPAAPPPIGPGACHGRCRRLWDLLHQHSSRCEWQQHRSKPTYSQLLLPHLGIGRPVSSARTSTLGPRPPSDGRPAPLRPDPVSSPLLPSRPGTLLRPKGPSSKVVPLETKSIKWKCKIRFRHSIFFLFVFALCGRHNKLPPCPPSLASSSHMNKRGCKECEHRHFVDKFNGQNGHISRCLIGL